MKTKKKNKKITSFIIILILLIMFFLLSFLIIQRYKTKINYENNILEFKNINEKNIFTINNITYFSSANAKEKEFKNNNIELKNLYQYTDIAIYINSNDINKTKENTLKAVSIENIKIPTPINGTAKIYYKNINDFSKSSINEKNIIKNKLNFKITNETNTNLNEPTLYNNLANPITLSYVNENIKENETIINNNNPITYDGNLLKLTNTTLTSIENNISFDLIIENNLNQKFKTTLQLNIPLKDTKNNKSIYDGNLIIKEKPNINLYRFK